MWVNWKILGMGFGYPILLWIILQVFLSSADIFQRLALKFQTFSIQIRWDIFCITWCLQMLSTCAKNCKFRKASLMLQFSIMRLWLLVANFIACCTFQGVWTEVRSDKMLGLIWIWIVWNSNWCWFVVVVVDDDKDDDEDDDEKIHLLKLQH